MPSAEVLCIGTELLLGQVLDTNSQFIALELAKLGIDCYFRTTVGDNKERIKQALTLALRRSDILLLTGGLGPTPDDLTTECLAELFGKEMVMDESVVERIREFFEGRGYQMPESNRKQGLRPEGAEILPNPKGSAPGIIWRLPQSDLSPLGIEGGSRLILTFPGVPSELETMWRATAEPLLRREFGGYVLWSCELKHYGIGESALAEQYAHLLGLNNPTVAPYAGRGECRLRVTAKAKSGEEAKALAEPIIAEIRQGSKHRFYGFDGETLESAVGNMLVERGWTIALAESCTGGLVSKRLTDIAGSSRYVELNVVTYSNEAKQRMLGVDSAILETYGAVSAECARAMAEGVRNLARAQIGVSVTGIAGPDGGTPEKPAGLVYLGLAADGFYAGRILNLPATLSRDDMRYRSASDALNMVRLFLINPALIERSRKTAIK